MGQGDLTATNSGANTTSTGASEVRAVGDAS